MRDNKLRHRGNTETEWRLLYRLFRATRAGRTLETIGARTPQQLLIHVLTVGWNSGIRRWNRSMLSAKNSYFAFRRQSEHDYFSDKFLGGVHHNFGDFKDVECGGNVDKYDVNEYRFSRGLKPVKWKSK